jgi:hypothetical protein
MAKHHRHHHRRRNPFGVSGTVVKDVAYNGAGAIAALWLSGFAGQTGWLDVAATAAAAVATSFAGKYVGGASASEELLKGGLLAAFFKAIKQTGVNVPGLGLYVNSYFSAPTSSDAYGRATPPTIMLPAPGAKGVAGLGYQRYRSRYQTRF